MLIFDGDHDQVAETMTMELTQYEVAEFLGWAESLSEDPTQEHCHVSDRQHWEDITLCVVTEDNMRFYSQQFRDLLMKERAEE